MSERLGKVYSKRIYTTGQNHQQHFNSFEWCNSKYDFVSVLEVWTFDTLREFTCI